MSWPPNILAGHLSFPIRRRRIITVGGAIYNTRVKIGSDSVVFILFYIKQKGVRTIPTRTIPTRTIPTRAIPTQAIPT